MYVHKARPRLSIGALPIRLRETVTRTSHGLLSANDERDAGEVDGSLVVREELGESPGGQSSRSNGVRMSGCAKGEG